MKFWTLNSLYLTHVQEQVYFALQERVVRDLAAALLQVAAGLHPRFIVAPLGDHDEATKEAKRKAKIQAKLRRRQERERREKTKVRSHFD